MIFLSIIYHWTYLYSLPWIVPLLCYVIGGLWTLIMVSHKRTALAKLTQQQANSHAMIVLAYLAVFISHYAMQSMAMNKFVTEVRRVTLSPMRVDTAAHVYMCTYAVQQ